MISPIIVTGAPYSGTSVVARVLQARLGVMMDEGPLRTDENKPFGYYEDHKMLDINAIAFRSLGSQYGELDKKVHVTWAAAFAGWLTYRAGKYATWGWKDPSAAGLIRYMHQFLDDPLWIICTRTDDQVIASQMKKGQYPEDVAAAGLRAYKEIFEREIPDAKIIDLSSHRTESDIEDELKVMANGRF